MTVVDRIRMGLLKPTDAIWARIESAEVLVINGEGSVHSSRSTAVHILESLRRAKERGLQAWIVNHGCWNCGDLMRLYDYADYVAVRDISSEGYLAQHGIAAQLGADCSLLSPPAEAQRLNRLLVCSGLAAPNADMIRRWAEELGCRNVVLCNDFYPRFTAAKAVKSKSAEDCLRLFASSRFVISSSYHGCIFAAMHGTPFLPVQVPGQPPKVITAAVESMGPHARQISSMGPAYVKRTYDEIRTTMEHRVQQLRRRARLNVPGGMACAAAEGGTA